MRGSGSKKVISRGRGGLDKLLWVVAARKRMARLIWVNKHGAGAPRLSRIRAWKLSFLNHLEMTGRGSGSLEMVCRGSRSLEVAGRGGGSLQKVCY